MKPRITLITLGVDDLDAAVRFYRDGLSWPTEGVVGAEHAFGAVAFFDLQPGLKLALWPRASIAHDAGIALDARSSTEFMLAHNVASRGEVDAVMADATHAGARIVKPASDTFWGGYAGSFQDPDGHRWEVAWNPAWSSEEAGTSERGTDAPRASSDAGPGAIADRESVHARVLDAPVESVFRALSEADHLARWWGPDGFTNTFEVFEFKRGGAWRLTMHGPDGTDYPNESVFREIVPRELVVLEHFGHHFFLTITLTRQGDKTLVGWRQLFDTAEHKQRVAAVVSQANEQNLDRLAAEVRGLVSSPPSGSG